MYFSEKNPPKGRGSSQQSKAACCSRKKESSIYFLLIFFQKEEKEVGSRLFQKNGSNSIRTKKQTGSVQAFQDWRNKAEQTIEEQLDKPENSSHGRSSFRIF